MYIINGENKQCAFSELCHSSKLWTRVQTCTSTIMTRRTSFCFLRRSSDKSPSKNTAVIISQHVSLSVDCCREQRNKTKPTKQEHARTYCIQCSTKRTWLLQREEKHVSFNMARTAGIHKSIQITSIQP